MPFRVGLCSSLGDCLEGFTLPWVNGIWRRTGAGARRGPKEGQAEGAGETNPGHNNYGHKGRKSIFRTLEAMSDF
jgi:hypothetical protein